MSPFIVCRLFKISHKHLMTKFNRNISTSRVFTATDSKYIISGPSLDPVIGVTVPEYVFSDISKFENSPAFSCEVSDQSYIFKQIHTMSHNFAAALIQHGMKKGDVLGILLPNTPEYPVVQLGTWLAGGIVSPISYSFTADEVSRQCQIAEVKFIVTITELLPLTKIVKSQIPAVQTIITLGDSGEGIHSFFDMVQVNSEGVSLFNASSIDTKNDIAMLPFSSGTTGPPKGVMLTHSNICTNIEQVSQPGSYTGKLNERLVAVLPFYHCYGCNTLIFQAIKLGSQVRSIPKFKTHTFTSLIKNYKPTTLHLVTPILQFMYQSPDFGKAEFESVHTIVIGAAPCGKSLINGILNKAGKAIFIQEGYGMTELTTVAHLTRLKTNNKKIGSIGEIVHGSRCKVIDPNTGASLSTNTPGELWIQGPQVMKGYYKNEKATSETMDSDGWLKTGDIVIYDEDKSFFIVDRMKELIKVKGLQVSPSELEDILRTSHEILDVAVVGVPHEKHGEAPRAFIVRASEKLTADRVHDFLERKISKHKKLSGGVEFIDKVPRAPSGKILRRLLLADYNANKEGKDNSK